MRYVKIAIVAFLYCIAITAFIRSELALRAAEQTREEIRATNVSVETLNIMAKTTNEFRQHRNKLLEKYHATLRNLRKCQSNCPSAATRSSRSGLRRDDRTASAVVGLDSILVSTEP